MNPEGIREIDKDAWKNIEKYFNRRDNLNLIKSLLLLELFPIKDSYVAYLKRDTGALKRNPDTINRLCGRIYEMGIAKIFERCSQPIETNRQIGPLFKNWLKNGGLGIQPTSIENFQRGNGNAILDASDNEMKTWCETNLGYSRDKGLDFVGRFNKNYVIGEAKFLTDFGGHQYAQFDDAISTISDLTKKAVKIAVLDGVLYIPSNNKMYRQLSTIHSEKNIFSALVLREFLYSL
jgi:hypothetical protein